MTEKLQLDIPILLPGVEDDQDECVARLVSMLEARDGIERIHVVHESDGRRVEHDVGAHPTDAPSGAASLCLHYDPERLSLARIKDIAMSAGATITERFGHAIIPFRLIGAEDDGARVESSLRTLDGVTAASVNLAAQTARVEYDMQKVGLSAVRARLDSEGADTSQAAVSESPKDDQIETPARGWYGRNQELAWSLSAGALTLAGWVVGRATGDGMVSIPLFLGAYFFGARDNVGHLFKDLSRGKFRFNIDLLMVVAAIGAAVLGEWTEGALLLFLFSLGHAMEHYAMGRARNAIKALAELAPQTAIVRRNGVDASVPIGQVRPGDLVVVKPAERIAVDGVVHDGCSAVNQAPITGESVPVEKVVADQVYAGSVNGEGVLIVKVTAATGDRTLDRVIKLVGEASTQKAPTQQFTERFEKMFVPAVLIADVLMIVVPPMLGLLPWSESFYRAMALLVAASPCALALGTPAAVLSGIAQAARNGVLIKGGAHLEALGTIDVFAMDKTGTITKGEPAVTDMAPGEGADESILLRTAAAVESQSQHPLARAIQRAAQERKLVTVVAEDVQSVTGRGVRGRVDGVLVEVGRIAMFEEAGTPPPDSARRDVERLEKAGRSTMIVRAVGASPEWLGVIGIADQPREGVRETLDELRRLGVRKIVMLTGDNAGVGAAIASAVGLDDVRAGLMPEDKVTAIKELAADARVAMVGDGVNDAPALAHATVGIAMGGAGTAAALETADVALMGDDLGRLPFAVGLSRQARSIIRQNLYFSLAVIAVLAIATVGGFARIGPAVIAHEGSTLVVIANALRLLRYRAASDST